MNRRPKNWSVHSWGLRSLHHKISLKLPFKKLIVFLHLSLKSSTDPNNTLNLKTIKTFLISVRVHTSKQEERVSSKRNDFLNLPSNQYIDSFFLLIEVQNLVRAKIHLGTILQHSHKSLLVWIKWMLVD